MCQSPKSYTVPIALTWGKFSVFVPGQMSLLSFETADRGPLGRSSCQAAGSLLQEGCRQLRSVALSHCTSHRLAPRPRVLLSRTSSYQTTETPHSCVSPILPTESPQRIPVDHEHPALPPSHLGKDPPTIEPPKLVRIASFAERQPCLQSRNTHRPQAL